MNLTSEQTAILDTDCDITINAVAGSGKTTTLIEYARSRRPGARILYLAFNRTVKLEARKRFAAQGLPGVQVETAHSLAYAHVVRNSRYRVLASGSYKAHELVQLLKLPAAGELHEEYVLATHVAKFLSYFCNSAAERVAELDYRQTITEPAALAFVTTHYAALCRHVRQLLARMESAEIEITHDFYLKKFQLAGKQLGFDYLLFDEAQDASGSMLAWFMEQRGTKVLVGDTHQQIYGWRFAINSLEKASFPSYPLTTSFRFGPAVASLATQVLDYKQALGPHEPVQLTGLGSSTAITTKAVIGRSNLGLLLKAFEYLDGPRPVQRLYFEGNLNSYTYADEGASLYDVLNLYNGRIEAIRDPLMRRMANLTELEAYSRQVEDAQLLMLIQVVEEYGNRIIDLLQELKRRQVTDGQRDQAELFFSTVHRCKGLEYDEVQLVSDFVTREDVEEWVVLGREQELSEGQRSRLSEEVNLLYVALTRARYQLHLPEGSRPEKYLAQAPVSAYHGRGGIVLLPPSPPLPPLSPVASVAWTDPEDATLTALFCDGRTVGYISKQLLRPKNEVSARIDFLELVDKYGDY